MLVGQYRVIALALLIPHLDPKSAAVDAAVLQKIIEDKTDWNQSDYLVVMALSGLADRLDSKDTAATIAPAAAALTRAIRETKDNDLQGQYFRSVVVAALDPPAGPQGCRAHRYCPERGHEEDQGPEPHGVPRGRTVGGGRPAGPQGSRCHPHPGHEGQQEHKLLAASDAGPVEGRRPPWPQQRRRRNRVGLGCPHAGHQRHPSADRIAGAGRGSVRARCTT